MEEEKVEQVVLVYLKSKGYWQVEFVFYDEQQWFCYSGLQILDIVIDFSIVNFILFYVKLDNDLNRYKEGYSKFWLWVYQLLDSYKNEFLWILYFVFVYCYIDFVGKGFIQEV